MRAISLLTSLLLQQRAPATGFEVSIQQCIVCRCSPSHYASNLNARKGAAPVQRRRQFVSRILHSGTLSLLTFPFATHRVQADGTKPTGSNFTLLALSSPEEISQYIIQNCNRGYFQSVKSSGFNFLYRGLSAGEEQIMSHQKNLNNRAIIILNEPYDLLDPKTYNSNEAALYFQSLEDKLSAWGSSIKPSNAHIATTCPSEASKWGSAVSIWPFGESDVDFLWLKDGGVFWPSPNQTVKAQPLKRSTNGIGLERALQGDAWEIMFRADTGFLVVPVELDDELRDYFRHAQ
ncbi:hypothetical protein HJC23_011283 [Cyclotella cryptica]|uniref:Uncharacterized protein n=1 Tax=Cyclotella cryptica TaxID=29204 RepID=A0ABD3QVD2_9STRA|eukprot:CCRYP_001663-RA/>CCRYP_001663-RA protein AED:0.14 eAED:0.14 QI:0/-1/0/1/-1/1/1/0/290